MCNRIILPHSNPTVQYTSPNGKQASHVPIPSLLCHRQTDGLFKANFSESRWRESKGASSGLYRGCYSTSKCSCQRVSTVWTAACTRHCYATIRQFLTVVLSFSFELLASVCHTVHNNKHRLLLCLSR